jgi:Glycosyl transferase family 21
MGSPFFAHMTLSKAPDYDANMASVCAIVPATNEPSTLDRCLAAIRAADAAPEELVVVGPPLMPTAAHARNRGAEQAKEDVLVFIDSDVEVHSDVFVRIRSAFEHDPDLAAMFGSYDADPDGSGTVTGFRNLLHHHIHQSSPGFVGTFWTGLGAVRRETFVAAGGFKTSLPWMEDINFGWRVTATGGRVRLDPDLQGKHLKSISFGEMVRTDFFHRAIPWVSLLLEGGAPSDQLNLGWRHRASAGACLIAAVSLAARRPAVAGAAGVTFIALNASFYRLLLRQRGAPQAVAGVGLHAVHHLTAVAAVPVAVAGHLFRTRRRPAAARSRTR